MTRIAHISDIHIRNLKFHKEYTESFEDLYKKVKGQDIDIIYIGGDIAHTKTNLSPEYFELCSNFLTNLAEIAPTYIILGNHDGNLKSTQRQDAVTPVVDALKNPNIFLIKNCEEVKITEDIVFNCLSVFDRENWIDPTDVDKINVALYHGSISGCSTDIGWVMDHGEEDLSIFDKFDYAMLGDIHKTNQILDKKGKVRYSGSLIQQNHGETNDKGFLVWDIKTKEDFSVKHIKVSNPKPHVTVELTSGGILPKNLNVPKDSRLRLVYNNVPISKVRLAVERAKTNFKPESIVTLNKMDTKSSQSGSTIEAKQENLRDIVVQSNLIKDYLEDYKLPEEKLEKIYKLNRKLNSSVEESEEIGRNINWKLISIEWDNLFNYGESNKIDFRNLNGITGIFGKNYSGKSSIIDAILFTIFNNTSKNERKNLSIINQEKDSCIGKVKIEVGSRLYTITRECEKYIKKLKGKETLEAKTSVDFRVKDKTTGLTKDLNETNRNETDKKIRKYFGSLEDFLFTSMTSQNGALNFINEGSTKRKELLAKFLDLEIFDQKFKLAKEESALLKSSIRKQQDRDFDSELELIDKLIFGSEENIEREKKSCKVVSSKIDILQGELQDVILSIKTLPKSLIDLGSIEDALASNSREFNLVSGEKKKIEEQIESDSEMLFKIEEFAKAFDFSSRKNKQDIIESKREELDSFFLNISQLSRKLDRKKEKTKLLSQVPCGDEYSSCRFIKDAYAARDDIEDLCDEIEEVKSLFDKLKLDIDKMEPAKNQEHLDKYTKLMEKRNKTHMDLKNLRVRKEKAEASLTHLSSAIERLNQKKEEYKKNKEEMGKLINLREQERDLDRSIEDKKRLLQNCNNKILKLYQEHGSLEQGYKNIEKEKLEYQKDNDDFLIYEMYLTCMHSCGISYEIIKNRLPIINNEIQKVLSNITNFEVFFEEDGKKLNILLQHYGQEPRPISLGSGAEKSIAAMAIRLALLTVSSLPKSNIFILDEPGTALDENNMEGFIQILEITKMHFKTVLLISHLESLKDCVDTQINIQKINNLAHVNV